MKGKEEAAGLPPRARHGPRQAGALSGPQNTGPLRPPIWEPHLPVVLLGLLLPGAQRRGGEAGGGGALADGVHGSLRGLHRHLQPGERGVRARQRLVANRPEECSPTILPLKTSASSRRTDGGLP